MKISDLFIYQSLSKEQLEFYEEYGYLNLGKTLTDEFSSFVMPMPMRLKYTTAEGLAWGAYFRALPGLMKLEIMNLTCKLLSK